MAREYSQAEKGRKPAAGEELSADSLQGEPIGTGRKHHHHLLQFPSSKPIYNSLFSTVGIIGSQSKVISDTCVIGLTKSLPDFLSLNSLGSVIKPRDRFVIIWPLKAFEIWMLGLENKVQVSLTGHPS